MLTSTIKAYPYLQFNDDPNIKAYFDAFNLTAQNYVDAFGNMVLPDYTSNEISGDLLDFVGENIYGIKRPIVFNGQPSWLGGLNSMGFNEMPLAWLKRDYSHVLNYIANDDIYKRVLTWNTYKGDGDVFKIRWLKRRINRFLFGPNGTDILNDNTYLISVQYAENGDIGVVINPRYRTVQSGAIFSRMPFNQKVLDSLTIAQSQPNFIKYSDTLSYLMAYGSLNVPFQYNVKVYF